MLPAAPPPNTQPDALPSLIGGERVETIYEYQALDCNLELYDISQHRGHIVIICNVASKCKDFSLSGYTILTTLYRRYQNRGLRILAFPCNQFGGCEPINEDEIAESIPCLYPTVGDISFDIMARVDVNGEHELPLFRFLKSRLTGSMGQQAVKWNFTYFVVNRLGVPVARFPPETTLETLDEYIQPLFLNEDGGADGATMEGQARSSGVQPTAGPSVRPTTATEKNAGGPVEGSSAGDGIGKGTVSGSGSPHVASLGALTREPTPEETSL